MTSQIGLFIASVLLVGCAIQSAPHVPPSDPITDPSFLLDDFWNDGQAEVAFYQVERTQNQYGRADEQSFLVGTYVVKHDFDRAAASKATSESADAVSSFKYALFYEFESGSYEYKRNYVINAAQADLLPLKDSFTSFDWCANIYREMNFASDGQVAAFMRSDDYGNWEATFDYQAKAYPPSLLPMLVRGLDFSDQAAQAFAIVHGQGEYVPATARLAGTETVETAAGALPAERIVVTYEAPVPSLIGEESELEETYWRGTDDERLLLKLTSATGRYQMTLVENLRSAYWRENLYTRLQRVAERP